MAKKELSAWFVIHRVDRLVRALTISKELKKHKNVKINALTWATSPTKRIIEKLDCFKNIVELRKQKTNSTTLNKWILYVSIMGKVKQNKGTEKKVLFCFGDHGYNAPMIYHFKNNLGAKIVLVEHGIGLYRTTSQKKKSLLGKLFKWHSSSAPGYNSNIDYIWAQKKSLLDETKNKKAMKISPPDFEVLETKGIMSKQTKEEIRIVREFKYIFISQPIEINREIEKLFEKMLRKIASKEEQLLIKPHPNEKEGKWSKFTNVYVLEKYDQVPAEYIISKFNFEKIFTIWSSTPFYTNEHCTFLYKILNIDLGSLSSFIDGVERFNVPHDINRLLENENTEVNSPEKIGDKTRWNKAIQDTFK